MPRRVARGFRDMLLWLALLMLLLLLSALYHLNLPLGHRVAGRGLTDWVSSQIDGTLVINDTSPLHGYATREGKITLASGTHSIRVDYFEATGYAGVALVVVAVQAQCGELNRCTE